MTVCPNERGGNSLFPRTHGGRIHLRSDGCSRDFNAPLGPHRERKGILFDVAGAQMCRIKHLPHKIALDAREANVGVVCV